MSIKKFVGLGLVIMIALISVAKADGSHHGGYERHENRGFHPGLGLGLGLGILGGALIAPYYQIPMPYVPPQGYWYCPYYGQYYPNVSVCPGGWVQN